MNQEAPITLPGHYVSQIFELMASRGAATGTLCAELGIAPATLQHSQVSMPWESFHRLIVVASRLFRDQSFGLLLGERLLINTHGPLGFAALSSTSLRDLVGLLEQYMVLRTDLLTVSHEVTADGLRLYFHENRPLQGIRQTVMEAVMLAVRNILDFATLGNPGIRCVSFSFAGDSRLASDVFRSPVQYEDDWNGFCLAAERLDQPLKMANASSYQEALAICQEELQKLGVTSGLAGEVKKLLLKSNNGFPSLEVVARHFHMTPRTLHRHLLREQSSYKEILDSVRHQLALRYLERQQMSVQEIAYVLGYSEIANFRRAFKRWQGMAPSAYRQINAG